jgi:homocysteine S-methyltransferase
MLTFFAAGADAATTASYQLHSDATDLELCAVSVRCARQAAEQATRPSGPARAIFPGGPVLPSGPGLVLGSLGAYGAILPNGQEFTGKYMVNSRQCEAVLAHHTAKAHALAAAGCDALILETVPCAAEAAAFAAWATASGSGAPSLPLAVSFSIKKDSDTARITTCGGDDLVAAVRTIVDTIPPSRLLAVGVNCCDARIVADALQRLNAELPHGALPLMANANSGEDWDAANKIWANETALSVEAYAKAAAGWVNDCGAVAVGGCCRIGPKHIAAIRASLVGNELN